MNQIALDLQPASSEYRTIPLTKGQVAIVDATDFDWLNQWRWKASWNKHTRSFYAARTVSKGSRPNRKFKTVLMARLIMNLPHGVLCDHKNHDTLDNRRFNLRAASESQNACNRRLRKDNTSGIKGVSLNRSTMKWMAQVTIRGVHHHLGLFDTKEAAADAYSVSVAELHGEFAHH